MLYDLVPSILLWCIRVPNAGAMLTFVEFLFVYMCKLNAVLTDCTIKKCILMINFSCRLGMFKNNVTKCDIGGQK